MSAREISVNAFVYTGFEALNKSLPFILVPILTHYLSTADLGLVAEFTAILGVLSVLTGLSVHGAVSVAFFKLDGGEISGYVFNVLLILLASTVVVLLLAALFGRFYTGNGNLPIFWIYIIVLVSSLQFVTNINLVLWQAERRALAYGTYQFLQSLLNFALSIFLVAVVLMGWQGRLLGQVSAVFIFALLSFIVLYRRGYLRIRFNPAYLKDALKFGVPLIPHGLSSWVFIGFNIVLISTVLGKAEAGIFSVAMQFAMIMTVIAQASSRAIQPILYQKLVDIKEHEKKSIVKYTYLGFLATIVVGGVVCAAGLLAIDLFVDEKFHEAKKYLPLLVLSAIFDGLYLLVVKYIFFVNKNHYLALATTAGAVIHVLVAVNLIDYLGLTGVAISSVISVFVYFILVWMLSAKVYSMPWFSCFRKKIYDPV